jgi:hypothetical protein
MSRSGKFGGGRILSRASVELMTSNQITPEQQAGSFDPTEGLVGVQFTQQLWTSPSAPPVQRDFWTAVYQAIAD